MYLPFLLTLRSLVTTESRRFFVVSLQSDETMWRRNLGKQVARQLPHSHDTLDAERV